MGFGLGKTSSVVIFLMSVLADASAAGACLQVPVSCPISSPFGNRYDPVAKDYSTRMHKGVDFACKVGTPVAAAEGGAIVRSRFQYVEGNQVAIKGASGMTSRYFHGSSLPVTVDPVQGPRVVVNTGDLVMMSGNTGARTTGPHLHFQVEAATGEAINPVPLFCGAPPKTPPGVLDAPGTPTDADPSRSAIAPANTPEMPAHLEGSFYTIVEDLIAARAGNPDYIKQLATLTDVRLYSELAYIDGVSLRLRHELMKRRERIQAMIAMLQVLQAQQSLHRNLANQKTVAATAAASP